MFEEGIRGADVVMALRIQRERMDTTRIPDVDAFCREWGITHIVFTAGIINKGFIAQKNAIAGVWEQLFHLHRLRLGSQVKLGESSQKGDITGFELRVNQKSLMTILRQLNSADE